MFGSHLSIAGGMHNALLDAEKLGMEPSLVHHRIGWLLIKLELPDDPRVSRRTQLVRAAQRFMNE